MSDIQSCFKRVEKKYLLTREQYKAMLLGMAFHMVPDDHPRYTIGNVYYDTAHYDLIRASLEKPIWRVNRVPSLGSSIRPVIGLNWRNQKGSSSISNGSFLSNETVHIGSTAISCLTGPSGSFSFLR